MFADPFTANQSCSVLTTAGPRSYAASERAADHSTYRITDAEGYEHKLFIGHQYGSSRNRYTFRYDMTGLQPNLLVPSENTALKQSVYVVADVPMTGALYKTTAAPLFLRNAFNVVGMQLIAASGDPPFFRILAGET